MINEYGPGVAVLIYAAVAFVTFGFFVKTFIASGAAAIFLGFFVAGLWPISGLVWLGAWLA